MKRALLVLLIAFPLLADDAKTKQQLIAELLDLLDVRAMVQAVFDDPYRGNYDQQPAENAEQARAFRDRLFSRLDYARYAEAFYAPLFDERFTAAELRELIAFYRTDAGRKSARLMRELSSELYMTIWSQLQEDAEAVAKDMVSEDEKKHPWKRAMADIRSLAIAIETYATDTNEYPKVATMDALEALLEPTYARDMPEIDPWGTPYEYISDGKSYRLASAGADRKLEWNTRVLERVEGPPRQTDDADADIIFQDAEFVQAPRE